MGLILEGHEQVGDVDITQLTLYTDAAMASADTTAYDALGVPAMAAGTSFNDPVTGVLTTKVTDSTTPGSFNWSTFYSTLGLQISQAWGAAGDQYTISWHSPNGGGAWMADYKLGGTLTEPYRTSPGAEGRFCFARSSGNEQIMYVANGTQLRRYDTATDAFADTGDFPYSWTTLGTAGTWLTMNNADSRATGITAGGVVTALDLSDGSVITQSITGLDEPYIGSGDIAFINAIPDKHWDLSTDTIVNLTLPVGWSTLSHTGVPNGFAFHYDVDAGGGVRPSTRILDDNTNTATVTIQGYWSDTHNSGHWWDTPAGTDVHVLQSNNTVDAMNDTASWKFSLVFVNTVDGGKRLLGHHYSLKPSGIEISYYDNAFATPSTDGKVVLFTSNMNETNRLDVFLMEPPRT